jgi:hypothetical protein
MDLLSLELANELNRDRARMAAQSLRASRTVPKATSAVRTGRLQVALRHLLHLVQEPRAAH